MLSLESGLSVSTLKRYHRKRKRIPFQKTTEKKQGKVVIPRMAFYQWLGEILVDPR